MSRQYTVLENNPAVMSDLAYQLGMSRNFGFFDIYSLEDPDISCIPRPVAAILAVIPLTTSWDESRKAEDREREPYEKAGVDEPVLWFKQTIPHACGIIGLLHCLVNGAASREIRSGSFLDSLRQAAIPLRSSDRALLLEKSHELHIANEAAAKKCDTALPSCGTMERFGQHFVAFVKGDDGHLWELEGTRKGPLDRGILRPDQDAFSDKAIELGIGKLINEEKARGGDLRFSCIALAARGD